MNSEYYKRKYHHYKSYVCGIYENCKQDVYKWRLVFMHELLSLSISHSQHLQQPITCRKK